LFLVVAPIVVLAAVSASLRFYCLGCRSLWLDEVATTNVLMYPSLGDAISYAGSWTDHTPLHFLLTWLLAPLGRDEFAVRIPYAVAGTLAAVAMYRLGSQVAGRTVGWTAGLLVAILPFAIFYSQESRPTILLVLLTTAMMSAAHAAAHRGSVIQWAILAVLAAADLYTGYLALTAVPIAYGYAGLVRLWTLLADVRYRRDAHASLVQMGLCCASAAAAAIAFSPWLGHLQEFLSTPDLGFGRVDSSSPITADAVSALLASLDLHGIVLWLTLAGVATALVDLCRRRVETALLPLLWFFLPLAFFAFRAGSGIVAIWSRYFAIDYPAALLLAAIGVWGLARLADYGFRLLARLLESQLSRLSDPARKSFRPLSRSLLHVTVCCVLLTMVGLDALPADADAYQRQKGSDYRGAVDRILSSDDERPVVLVVGQNPDWRVEPGLRYYAWARRSSLQVIDALKIDKEALATLQSATSLWTAGWAGPTVPATDPPGPARELYNDVWLLPTYGSVASRAEAVLDWAQQWEPEVGAARKLVAFASGRGTPGPELLPPPTKSVVEGTEPSLGSWVLQPHVTVAANGKGFVLQPVGNDVDAIYVTRSLQARGNYLFSVGCDPNGITGSLRVFVVLEWSAGSTVLPDGAGYTCPVGSTPAQVLIPFSVTAPSTTMTIWLRATGVGVGTYSDPSLRSME
jgi:hypothetical protein